MNNDSNILTVRNLALSRGALALCHGLSFTMKPGQMQVLRGPNGTGKTTLLQSLAGLLPVDAGEILWQGQPIKSHPQYPHIVCYVSHQSGLRRSLSVYDNLAFFADMYGNPELLRAALNYFDLTALMHLPISALSAGWTQRAQLARLIVSSAPLWLLDEPSHHLDSKGIDLLQSLVATRLERGGMIIMASHATVEGIDAGTITLGQGDMPEEVELT